MMRMIGLTGIGCVAALLAGAAGAAEAVPKELMAPNKRVAEATGLPDQGNHDPSNIIHHDGNPIMSGHAFSAWKHRDGIAMVTGAGSKQVVFWSTDGVNFVPAGPFKNRSTGFYVPEGNFTDGPDNRGVTWGMDVTGYPTAPGKTRLFRFECDLGVAAPGR